MPSVEKIKCPYCNKVSYFEENLTQGYCTFCGRIIYADPSSERIIVQEKSETLSKESIEYVIVFYYTKKVLSGYAQSVTILIDNKQKAVATSGKPCSVKVQGGNHSVVVGCHITAGVNSTDVVISEDIHVSSNLRYKIECGGSLFRNLFLEKVG